MIISLPEPLGYASPPSSSKYRRRRSLLLLTLLLLLSTGDRSAAESNMVKDDSASVADGKFACNHVRYHYTALSNAKGFNADNSQVPTQAITGSHLKICAQGFTCCTADMESQLSSESSKDYQRVVQDKIVGLRHTFESRTSKFDRFFRELLVNSRQDLHSMFVQTYGMFYQRHSEVFSRLFQNLTDYYVTGKTDLQKALDSFYDELYIRMFKIMNPQYAFPASYWECVQPMMNKMKPFGDIPKGMKQQVQNSFVAARAFVQALATGRDAVQRIMDLPPSDECSSALMRMMYCPHCRGLPGLKPCNNFCLNVMKGCLAHQADLDTEWNNYIDALMRVLERLEGPFNIENVINDIDVKISEAVMIFQESGNEISQKVFAGCDPDKATRRWKRDAGQRTTEELRLEQLQHGGLGDSKPRPTTAAGTNLDQLAVDIKEMIRPVKGFWKNLPYSLCNDEQVAAPAKRAADCWNGITKDRYRSSLVGDGVVNQVENPEVPLKTYEINSVIGEQIMKLRLATSRLREAAQGQQIPWTPPTDVAENASPVAIDDRPYLEVEEFSGSGDGGVPEETDDEDLLRQKNPATPEGWDTNQEEASGSGMGDWETDSWGLPPTSTPRSFLIRTRTSAPPAYTPPQYGPGVSEETGAAWGVSHSKLLFCLSIWASTVVRWWWCL